MQNLENFNETEKQIIDLFLVHKKSIREITEIIKGYGRTKVNNVLKKYASLSDENAHEISLRKISLKQHKEVTQKEEKGMTQEETQKIYEEIMSGEKLLRTLAKKYKYSESYIKDRIILMLEDDEAIEKFNLKNITNT